MAKRRTKTKMATSPTLFRSASRSMKCDEWFQHRVEVVGTDIEKAELICKAIASNYKTDPWKTRTFVVQSSVDGGKSWQTQRCVQGDQV